MSGDDTNPPSGLSALAMRYPERTHYLSQVFKDTATSYKLVWFLAILSLLRRAEQRSLRLTDLLTEMVVTAWHPVCFYRLSLGSQDKLQNLVLSVMESSGLPPNSSAEAIRKFVEHSPVFSAKLDYFKRYVPTRFLTPWFDERLRGTRDSQKDSRIKTFAKRSQGTPIASPYFFDDGAGAESLLINDSWRTFLTENLGVVQSFAEHHFALYLQARNPNVPGIVNKLLAPTMRQLRTARDFWLMVRNNFDRDRKIAQFKDIYSEHQLNDRFSIDHFLPWSFVVHDLLWNLTPVEPTTNSIKNDLLPDLDLYLPLAKLHFAAIKFAKQNPKVLEDYVDCFKQDCRDLLALGEDHFIVKYREVILPQAQIAMNQGFQAGWRFCGG
jgi:hypothetical protein